jgi:beta-phosphoglucomutase-like phosphatase (HAD superfamily)
MVDLRICLASIVLPRRTAGIGKSAELSTRGSADAQRTTRVQHCGVTSRETERAELDALRSEWRKALLAAREALRADEEILPEAELKTHERHLRGEYESAATELRRFALDEGLPTELAEPFLPRALAQRALGLPAAVRACVFELDDVLVGSSSLHREAWTRTLNELLATRIDTVYGRLVAPFDPRGDYSEHIEGRPRLEGVRAFLSSRGIRLPEGAPGDPAGAETVHGVANRKSEWLGLLLEQRGVDAFDGVRHFLELARDARIGCAVASASAHTGEILERSGLAELVQETADAETNPGDRLLAACRSLHVEPEQAASFQSTRAGVAAARAAGFGYVIAIDPAGDPDRLGRLRAAGANLAVRGLGDLLARAA